MRGEGTGPGHRASHEAGWASGGTGTGRRAAALHIRGGRGCRPAHAWRACVLCKRDRWGGWVGELGARARVWVGGGWSHGSDVVYTIELISSKDYFYLLDPI